VLDRSKAVESTPVPARALGLSLLALSAPVLGSVFAPEWMTEESGLLLWLSALIPPFLLTYYRGWQGASLALAGGMAALTVANLATVALRLPTPEFRVLFWMVATYIVVCIGIGLLAELLRRERAAAESMALTDMLTGMPNRRHASIFLDAAFASAVRGDPVTVVMMDLDRFKLLNDRHGHREGDRVLREFADALRTVTRRMDLSARWGGEEFLSVLHRCTSDGAAIFLDRLRREFAERSLPHGPVTFSAGVAQYAPGYATSEDLVHAADLALYAAKEAGRDRHRTAPPPRVVSEGLPGAPEVGGPGVLEEDDELTPALLGGSDEEGVPEPPPGLPLRGGHETILVVDDERTNRVALGKVLRRLGYRVVEAPDGESALATARSLDRLDLLVTDLVMPGMSGFVLAIRLQEERGPSRILYISGKVRDDIEWASAPGAVQRYLIKPLEIGDLADAVREVLDVPVPRPLQTRRTDERAQPR
jgi:diguanylate cyclase (GGDEF)-like protein